MEFIQLVPAEAVAVLRLVDALAQLLPPPIRLVFELLEVQAASLQRPLRLVKALLRSPHAEGDGPRADGASPRGLGLVANLFGRSESSRPRVLGLKGLDGTTFRHPAASELLWAELSLLLTLLGTVVLILLHVGVGGVIILVLVACVIAAAINGHLLIRPSAPGRGKRASRLARARRRVGGALRLAARANLDGDRRGSRRRLRGRRRAPLPSTSADAMATGLRAGRGRLWGSRCAGCHAGARRAVGWNSRRRGRRPRREGRQKWTRASCPDGAPERAAAAGRRAGISPAPTVGSAPEAAVLPPKIWREPAFTARPVPLTMFLRLASSTAAALRPVLAPTLAPARSTATATATTAASASAAPNTRRPIPAVAALRRRVQAEQAAKLGDRDGVSLMAASASLTPAVAAPWHGRSAAAARRALGRVVAAQQILRGREPDQSAGVAACAPRPAVPGGLAQGPRGGGGAPLPMRRRGGAA